MTTLVKTNVSGYLKNPATGLVINTNEDEYRIYQSQKAQHKKHLETLHEVEELKRELTEMKQLFMEKIKSNV